MADTVTLPGVEIFQSGVHNGDAYSEQDLDAMVSAAGQVGFVPPLKLGHMTDGDTNALLKSEGLPAFGYVRNLRRVGTKLLADLAEVPKRIADLVKRGAYRSRSAEIFWNYRNSNGAWPRVLKAVALLGGEIPAVGSLKDIEALYSIPPDGSGTVHAYAMATPPAGPRFFVGEDDAEEKFYVVDRHDDNQIVATYSDFEQAEQACKTLMTTHLHDQSPTVTPSAARGFIPTETESMDAELIQGTYAATGAAVVDLAKRYQRAHPGLSYEQCQKAVLAEYPELATAYAESRAGQTRVTVHGTVSPAAGGVGGGSNAKAPWQQAGDELSKRAKARMARDKHLSFEEAFSLECQADPELKIRYEGRN